MAWRLEKVKATYCCNAELFKFYRERCGLTQQEFAEKAGYSRRLIVKAESGKSIASGTISDLAETLSEHGQTIYPEDLISDPIQFARTYIHSLYVHQRDMIPNIAPFLAENVRVHVPGDPSLIPFAGTYYGVRGFAEMIEKFFSVLEVPANHDHWKWYEFLGSGNEVIVWGKSWIHPIGRPLKEPIPIANRMVFERGLLVSFEDQFDTKEGGDVISKLDDVD